MKTYISILRGINVSGHRSIKMETLRQLFSEVGLANAQTYIQSGNVVFQSKQESIKNLEATITQAIKIKFDYDVPVLVIDWAEFKLIVENNPFLSDTKKDQAHLHVSFLAERPNKEYYKAIEGMLDARNEFQLLDRAIYLYCPEGYSKCKFSNSFLESKLKVAATTRNWKTSLELLNIAGNITNLKLK